MPSKPVKTKASVTPKSKVSTNPASKTSAKKITSSEWEPTLAPKKAPAEKALLHAAPKKPATEQKPISPSPEIVEAFHRKLQESALDTEELIADHKFTPMSAAGAEKLGLSIHKAGFKIPYFSLDGKETGFFRFRYLEDTRTGITKQTDAKTQRYGQVAGTMNEAYFSPIVSWEEVAKDAEYDLWITEGELKAACACSMGITCIGLGGVWNFKSTKRKIAMLPELEAITWTGRRVYICYDSDASSNPMVMQAETALAKELTRLSAFPTIVRLPPKADGHKNGLDDFLVEKGVPGLDEVRKGAIPFADAQVLHDLNQEVIYVRDPGFVVRMDTFQKLAPQAFTAHAYSDRHLLRTTDAGKLVRVSAANEWVKWPGRAAIQGFTYSPGQDRTAINEYGQPALNVWRGWGCESKQGDISPWKEMLDYQFQSSPEGRQWFERWLAYPIQHPGAKLATAAVIWGRVHGTGKSFIGETMARIYGENFVKLTNEQLGSRFNNWAENKQFAMGEEITGMDRRGMMDKIKNMITEEKIMVKIEYIPAFEIPARTNFYFVSNHPDAFQLEDTDRRFFVHEAPDMPREDAFYRRYREWLKESNGAGPAALRWHFEHLDLGDFNPMARALRTKAKEEMIVDSMSDIERWLHDLKRDPESCLRIGSTVVKHRFWSSQGLLDMYDPDGRRKLTPGGMARALKKAGLNPLGEFRTRDGLQALWAVRAGESVGDAGQAYNAERGFVIPMERTEKPSTKGRKK